MCVEVWWLIVLIVRGWKDSTRYYLAIWQSGNLADGAYLEHVPGQSMWQQKKVEETELFQREMEEVM